MPKAVGTPATSTSSLTAIGMPSSGAVSPAARRLSAAAASASADSVSTTRKAFNVGWLTSIARRERRTNSSDVTARVASW
ncbi:Uncharacterised protein [Mycobacterium tuberculosis]|uniref:Uncharacterized protein n=1 Tax=Mycobacterium tuberculosis TaxID=1773 RepID=A0A655JIB2_MYCTX|nr:Uncharacterised protein [Mycobacterium tuberculosis]CKU32724.1 Uncharacterised protein [Mycobacterium tuberculosis]COW95804.1 Uncharacterised protein [Mycobacterium tuberculosis]